jgi:integrase
MTKTSFASITLKTAAVHVVTYFIVGVLSFLFLDYAAKYADPAVANFVRQTDHPLVAAGPFFQILRGLLFGIAFFALRESIFPHKHGWLTAAEAEQLINTPVYRWQREEIPLLKAVRDQAVLAVMIGTGLRRAEVASLTWEMVQQRDGRWAIIDLVGKRGRVRSVGIPPWVRIALDRWAEAVGLYQGRIFHALNKDGSLAGSVRTKGGSYTDGHLTPQAIYNVVKEHVLAAGHINRKGDAAIAAHDLRRTAAALALKGGADLRQIQQMLGHASITTTERYLEPMRSLQVTAGDFIQIELALAAA